MENLFERYFEQHGLYKKPAFNKDLQVIVVIPVLDDWEIFRALDSLCACSRNSGAVGVIIVVNHAENAENNIKESNRQLLNELLAYFRKQQAVDIEFFVIEAFELPAKKAGVGYARKIGMDAAAWWLGQHGKSACPILSLDADTLVEKNYIDAICDFFRSFSVAGVSIPYEHRLDECQGLQREAIIKYELYLRYYSAALAYVGHPYFYHCIGSAFAVRASAYIAEGGMNKRQAGEDFYFLQKLISTGKYDLLHGTKVYPSPRFSTRTPFGTGREVERIVKEDNNYSVYCWEAFVDLKRFFSELENMYKADSKAIKECLNRQAEGFRYFWEYIDGMALLEEVNANCASLFQFKRRFFDRFNAFRVLKYLNFVHEQLYVKRDIALVTDQMFAALNYPLLPTLQQKLEYLRHLSQ